MLVAVAIAAVPFALYRIRDGVQVRVANHGPERLSSFVIHVTGNSYPIGQLDVGESRTVRVRPSSESHVEVEFVDPLGQRKRSAVDCYFEPGHHSGTIAIELENGAIKRVHDQTRLRLLP